MWCVVYSRVLSVTFLPQDGMPEAYQPQPISFYSSSQQMHSHPAWHAHLPVDNVAEGESHIPQQRPQKRPYGIDSVGYMVKFGVLGVLPGVAGTIQATEAIKIILGAAGILSGKLLCFNLQSMRFNACAIPKQHCAHHPVVAFERETSPRSNMNETITPLELQQWLQSKDHEIQLIDVRQPYERDICHIGGELMPLPDIESAMLALNKQKPVVIYCRSGVRSLQALKIFLNAGFQDVHHLEGGILNWQATIDPRLMRY